MNYTRSFTEGKASTVCLPFAYEKKEGDGLFYNFTGIEKDGNGNFVATMTEHVGDYLAPNTPFLYKPATTGDVDFGGDYKLPDEITAGTTTYGDWTFVGTYETVEWTTAPTGVYGFSAQAVGGIGHGQFVKVGAYVRVRPMRCYLRYKNGGVDYSGAPGLNGVSGGGDFSAAPGLNGICGGGDCSGAPGLNVVSGGETLPETISVRLVSADGDVTAIGSLDVKTGEVSLDANGWYTLDGTRLASRPTRKGIYVNNGHKIVVK